MIHPRPPRILDLPDFQPVSLPAADFPAEAGAALLERFPAQVAVEFPSPKTGGSWELRSLGWAGRIRPASGWILDLRPRTGLAGLFRMLEYAYGPGWRPGEPPVPCSTVEGLFEELSLELARRILDRCRRGLHRAPLEKREVLPFLRGRWEARVLPPGAVTDVFPCRFGDLGVDHADNQILLWTLSALLGGGRASARLVPALRLAIRDLEGRVSLRPFRPGSDLLPGRRSYGRLNADYRPMHALCRFFLDHAGPRLEGAGHEAPPFLLNMPLLFERFLRAWLARRLPPEYALSAQEEVRFGPDGLPSYRIDLVVREARSGRPRLVLDTKYKAPDRPDVRDINQVLVYALALGCDEAALIYPKGLEQPLDARIGGVRVRGLGFPLEGDWEREGEGFLEELLREVTAG